ncbi:DUF616 domain-containing protein [Shewanella sp. A32]|uniref:glycosyltransferase domain-containing protein n=1 Tax=Shewanella sp. A32 TaxID=3031327 RepID=UPI0023B926A3|nr:glycosyltransferase domain-containing protein [Shewanella sp. A32]MDF0533018.1 DUF616 domain-containing protein [Shewanella sp. A32]
MKNKRLVYTVIFGGYDTLNDFDFTPTDVDYVCITDDPNLQSNSWKIVYVEKESIEDPILLNRMYKFFPYKFFEYSESIYLDGNISVKSDLNFIFDKYLSLGDIAIPKHPFRTCIYQEAKECISIGKADSQQVNSQMSKYKYEGFPQNFGLFENNIIVRRHSKLVINLMDSWWEEFNLNAKRDQLSLSFLLWKYDLKCCQLVEGPRYSSKFFNFKLHKKEECLPIYKKWLSLVFLRRKQSFFYFALFSFFNAVIRTVKWIKKINFF